MNRNDLIELSKQYSHNEYTIKTIKNGKNLIIKLNNDYMDLNVVNIDFFDYILDGKTLKRFDIIFMDLTKLRFPMNSMDTTSLISIDEIPVTNGFLLRKLDQNSFLCLDAGKTQIKLNSFSSSELNNFINMNVNLRDLNIEAYKKINLNENAESFDFFSSNFYEFKFDSVISLKFFQNNSECRFEISI
jgi:hypothetical protein